mmetsp:Transcript_41041/g.95084  ORF Transcript_41041/g.95084 Transcript_41041/m.95084 type:complete len:1229 (+) Transcript_41041:51-3737(+)
MHHRVGLGALLRSLPCSRVVLFCARGEEAEAKRAEEARHGARRCSGSAPARAAAAAILLASRAARAAETLGLEGPELAAVRTEFDLGLKAIGISAEAVGGWTHALDGLADPTTSATRRTNTAGGPISSGSGGVVSAPCPSLVEAVSTVVLVTSRLLCAVDSAAISRVVLLSDDAHFCAQLAAALKAQSASQSRSAASLSVDFADFSPHALAGEGGGTLAAAAPGERACVALLRALGCEESADASDSEWLSVEGTLVVQPKMTRQRSDASIADSIASQPSAAARYLLAKELLDTEARHKGVESALAHALAEKLRARKASSSSSASPPRDLTHPINSSLNDSSNHGYTAEGSSIRTPNLSVENPTLDKNFSIDSVATAEPPTPLPRPSAHSLPAEAGWSPGAASEAPTITPTDGAQHTTYQLPAKQSGAGGGDAEVVVRVLDLGAGALSMVRPMVLAATRAAAFAHVLSPDKEASGAPRNAPCVRVELVAFEALAEVAAVGAQVLEAVAAAAAPYGASGALSPLRLHSTPDTPFASQWGLPDGWTCLCRMSGWLPAASPALGPVELGEGVSVEEVGVTGAWVELLVVRADCMGADSAADALSPLWAELAAAPTGAVPDESSGREGLSPPRTSSRSLAAAGGGGGELSADVLVACAFADLFEPAQLAEQLHRLAPGALAYLPITFDGDTWLEPSSDTGEKDTEEKDTQGVGLTSGWLSRSSSSESAVVDSGRARVPSDALVFQAYHEHLQNAEGQFTDVQALVSKLKLRGAVQLAQGSSNWRIAPPSKHNGAHAAVWRAMLRFVARGTAARLWPLWSLPAWQLRVRQAQPFICTKNVDVLVKLGSGSKTAVEWDCAPLPSMPRFAALVFHAPRRLLVDGRVRPEGWCLPFGHVEVRTEASLVSSGTELKFFRGDFTGLSGDGPEDDGDSGIDEAEPLDASIAGMGSAAAYPLEYGYSLCGTVTAAGLGVPVSLLGQRVFAFHPHASAAIVNASELHLVPSCLGAEEAVYLPAMETALSIAHDACLREGERVLVLGQGLIGLLVTAVLAAGGGYATSGQERKQGGAGGGGGRLSTLHAIDPIARRRVLSRLLGADGAYAPGNAPLTNRGQAGGYDVAIEVSGSPRALQAALDAVRPGGRVVVASWYAGEVELQLGTRFHRSHVTIVASQVSELPSALQGTWDKARRFDEAWRLLAHLRPSRALTTLRVPLSGAQGAFEALDRAAEVAVQICY